MCHKYDISVFICCHNRKDKTLRCLSSLIEQESDLFSLKIIVVDDGSDDGTSEAIQENFSEVRLVKGDGSLFWSGAMRLAYDKSQRSDYYLWLNDDLYLKEGVIDKMLRYSLSFNCSTIVTGAVVSLTSGKVAYGGLKRRSPDRLRFSVLEPLNRLIECDATNGNCVLIPKHVYEKVGNIDPYFEHAHGDIDFGMRAVDAGFRIVLSNEIVGSCETRFLEERVYTKNDKMLNRLKLVANVKGLKPKEWWFLCRRHSRKYLLLSFVSPYLRLVRGKSLGFVQRPR